MDRRASTFHLAPLSCGATGRQEIDITFESDDECFKSEVFTKTFSFRVVEGSYPCFSRLVPPILALYNHTEEQIIELPDLKYLAKFEYMELLKIPDWLYLNLTDNTLRIPAVTMLKETFEFEIEWDLCKTLSTFQRYPLIITFTGYEGEIFGEPEVDPNYFQIEPRKFQEIRASEFIATFGFSVSQTALTVSRAIAASEI